MKANQLSGLILFCAVVFLSTTIHAGNKQTRQISRFHGVSVSTGIDLYLAQKDVEGVVVEANADELEKVITQVEGGILKIYLKQKSWFNLNWGKEPHKVYVSFKNLDKLEASSGSDVKAEQALKLDKLDINASSGSDIKLEVEAGERSVSSSSGSYILLKGRAATLHADASSGSGINAGELQAKKCDAGVSSGSDIKVFVTDELKADASSGGDITYSGNPAKKDIKKSSGGGVHGR